MKLLVMGAGYVGSALLKYLQSQAHEIYITTTQEERIDELKAYGQQVLVLHPNEDKNLKKLIQRCDGMVILVAPKNSQTYEETYLKTAQRIYSALEDRETPFYLLYTSSTSVYEGMEDAWLTEDVFPNPESENSKLLLEAENCYLNCRVDTCILRLGGIYGPERELANRARRFSGKELPGTGDEATNHIHLDDILSGILYCLDHHLTGVYHLVNDDHPSRKELYTGLCHSASISSPIWNTDRSQQVSKSGYIVSNQKIKEAGFTFRHPSIKQLLIKKR